MKNYGLIRPQHIARRDAKQHGIADLPSGTGDRDSDGLFHKDLQIIDVRP